jgi:hypothetical protein
MEEKAVIPRLLKIFTGYLGVIQNIQLQIHRLFQYVTTYMADQPDEYLKLLNNEKKYWQDEAVNLMEDNNFDEVKGEIMKRLPRKIDGAQITRFAHAKLTGLAAAMVDLHNEVHLRSIRKTLQAFLYLREYVNIQSALPESIAKQEDLETIISTLEEFKNTCAGLNFLQPEYVDNIRDEKEKNLLSVFQKSLVAMKNELRKKIAQELQGLSNEISQRKTVLNH